jgi:hypothetical protein
VLGLSDAFKYFVYVEGAMPEGALDALFATGGASAVRSVHSDSSTVESWSIAVYERKVARYYHRSL